ncbi:MAG: trypsin-like peptidase domain-containing protein [Vicinamibacterales bacterium]
MIRRFLTATAIAAALVCPAAHAEVLTPEEAGRAVLDRYSQAIVTLKLAVKTRVTVGGDDRTQESRTETIGTIVDPSGMTTISLSSIDPSETVGAMASQQARRSGNKVDISVDSEVTNATIVLADGTEMAARVVLRDKDLDLAIVQPISPPPKPLTFVDLSGGRPPKVLDLFVALYRLGKMANRVPTASLERINAMVAGPRPYFVPGTGQGLSGIGSPVFNLDGGLIGLLLIRSAPPDDDGNIGTLFNGSAGMGLLPIIVPVAQIRESVEQARESAKE